jgi:hypothetical protein
MAGDWIKMQTELLSHPRLIRMYRHLVYGESLGFLSFVCGEDAIGVDAHPSLSCDEIVTRALRHVRHTALQRVALSLLLDVWCYVNAHCKVTGCDAVMSPMSVDDIDIMIGVEGFGDAMLVAGWIQQDEANDSLIFPNFCEHNEPACVRREAKSGAQRTREYRQRKQTEGETSQRVTRGDAGAVTGASQRRDGNVTPSDECDAREEKRRVEKKSSASASADACASASNSTSSDQPSREPIPSAKVEVIYRAYPRKVGKKRAIETIRKAIKDIAARGKIPVDDAADWLHGRVVAFARSPAGQAGEFTPHPSTWFQQGRYDDDDQDWRIERGGGNGRGDNGDGKPAVNHGASWDEWG